MKTEIKREVALLENIINEELKPYVKRIDAEAYYAESYLRKLGEAGFLSSENKSKKDTIMDEMYLVEETAKVCMTTAFCLWCHLAALTYVRNTKNEKLKNELLPALESGEILAGTGLSNPMKFYAGLGETAFICEEGRGRLPGFRCSSICFKFRKRSFVWLYCWFK